MLVTTRRGVDRICVRDRKEATDILFRLESETELSKKEIVELVSFDLSVADVIRCYNDFSRAERGSGYAKTFPKAA